VEPSECALGVELVGGSASESTGASSGSIPVRSARRRSVIRSRGVPGVGARSLRQLFCAHGHGWPTRPRSYQKPLGSGL